MIVLYSSRAIVWESESESVAITEKSNYRGIILLSIRSVTYRNLVTVPYFFDLSLGIRYVVDLTECGVYKVVFYINISFA